MKPILLLLLLFFNRNNGYTQTDLLVLKQRNQTIQTWIPGSFINFQFSSRQWIQGIIKSVRNDSILMEQIILEKVPNQFGFLSIDTAKMGLMKFHVKEIYGMPKRDFGSSMFSNGSLFQLGSAAYILLNIFNSVIHNEAVFSATNLQNLGIAGGVFLIGTLLASTHKTYVVLGKKYTMKTIHTGNGTPFPPASNTSKNGL